MERGSAPFRLLTGLQPDETILTLANFFEFHYGAGGFEIIPDNALELRYESLTCNKSAPFIRDS